MDLCLSFNSPFHGYLFHLHYNVFERGCEAISGNNYFALFARNCLTSTFKYVKRAIRIEQFRLLLIILSDFIQRATNRRCEKEFFTSS